jgi:NitT/TauT family transport system ATP-binding protein
MNVVLSASGVRKSFDGVVVLEDISVRCDAGAITAVVGPSGCGKSTLLNLIAGLDARDDGDIVIETARVGYMMQDSLLLPWRTLEQNALLGAEITESAATARASLFRYLQAFGVWNEREKYPAAASGGMKQRIALARTLLVEPSLLLLDEPFANLDFDIKLAVQGTLLRDHAERQTSMLWVTHDIEDAIALSDHIVVLSDKPTTIKAEMDVELGLPAHDPIAARKSPRFREYFAEIWEHLRYVTNGNDES